MMKVYLSGGMKGGWQDIVKDACAYVNGFYIDFIDPREHGCQDEKEYTVWDLAGVRVCDVVFAYMEADNPSGFGLTYECGYGLGLGKTVILVDAKMDKYMAIVRESVTIRFDTLEQGIEYLKKLDLLYR